MQLSAACMPFRWGGFRLRVGECKPGSFGARPPDGGGGTIKSRERGISPQPHYMLPAGGVLFRLFPRQPDIAIAAKPISRAETEINFFMTDIAMF